MSIIRNMHYFKCLDSCLTYPDFRGDMHLRLPDYWEHPLGDDTRPQLQIFPGCQWGPGKLLPRVRKHHLLLRASRVRVLWWRSLPAPPATSPPCSPATATCSMPWAPRMTWRRWSITHWRRRFRRLESWGSILLPPPPRSRTSRHSSHWAPRTRLAPRRCALYAPPPRQAPRHFPLSLHDYVDVEFR